MPVGLKFQRKHRFLGYKLKYIIISLQEGIFFKKRKAMVNVMLTK